MNAVNRTSLFRICVSITAALFLLMPHTGRAAQLPLATAPLFLSTPVEPNVMLLIDNSGSMDNIIWADGYNNATTYPSWGFSASAGNIHLSQIGNCAGGGGWKQGSNGGTTKCLRLPDPVGGGNTRYTGNYLNYLFNTYATNTDLTLGQIPTDYRMNVARNVASGLVTTTTGVRFGLTSFNFSQGGTVNATCGSSNADLTTAISGLTASTWTPLAETYYEITRYFRGLPSHYNSGVRYTSPIQYRCQKNFAVVITDGLPTYDMSFPVNDPSDATASLPNWDGLAPNTTTAMYPNFPPYSDGFQPSSTQASEGYSLYLDDIAKFGYDIDLMKNPPLSGSSASGNDLTGSSFDATDFPKQNLETYTVGFSVANQMLQDAAAYGKGIYYTASNAAQLTAALQNAIADIRGKTSSAAAVAVNSRSLNTNTRVYQGMFISGEWSGDLKAFAIDANGNVGAQAWSASAQVAAQPWDTGTNSRQIITRNATQGIPFRWNTSGTNALTAAQQTALNTNPASNTDDGQGQARLNYLRGDPSNEGAGNNYRARGAAGNKFKLGDIVNSAPFFVGTPGFLPNGLAPVTHTSFRAAYAGRREMIYVGGNDGMLHGFDAATGDEKIAYVPSAVFQDPATNSPKLNQLTNPNYSHRFFVDGSPTVNDVFGTFTNVAGACPSPGCWRTVLVSGLGGGGKGVFALDVTDPAGAVIGGLAFNESNAQRIALWEFDDASDMGYSYAQPTIAKMNDGSWAAIFGNGYNSVNERPVLYIVNAITGALIQKIILNATTGASNGLSTPAVVDKDGDFVADYIFAGDLQGNMWKIDVTASNSSSWGSFYRSGGTDKPLFKATDGSGVAQPITQRPEIGDQPTKQGGYMVYFGTGRYVAATDNMPAASPVHTFYGVWDRNTTTSQTVPNTASAAVARTRLRTQTIGTATVASRTVRSVTNNTIDVWDDSGAGCNTTGTTRCMGWQVDLLTAASDTRGEMSVSNPVLLGGGLPRIIFTTLIPTNEACSFGGTSWLMELDPVNGGRLSDQVFDINGDGKITSADMISGTTPVAGISSDIGIMPEPVIVRDPANKRDLKIVAGSSGTVKSIINYVDRSSGGRQSWRQLR